MKLKVIQKQLEEHLSQRQALRAEIDTAQRNLDAVEGAIQALELLVKKEQERLAKGHSDDQSKDSLSAQ